MSWSQEDILMTEPKARPPIPCRVLLQYDDRQKFIDCKGRIQVVGDTPQIIARPPFPDGNRRKLRAVLPWAWLLEFLNETFPSPYWFVIDCSQTGAKLPDKARECIGV